MAHYPGYVAEMSKSSMLMLFAVPVVTTGFTSWLHVCLILSLSIAHDARHGPQSLLSLALTFVQIMLLYTHHLNSAKLSITHFLVKFSVHMYLLVNSVYGIYVLGILKALLGGFIAILVQLDHSNSKHFITLPGSNGLNFECFCNLNAAIYSALHSSKCTSIHAYPKTVN